MKMAKHANSIASGTLGFLCLADVKVVWPWFLRTEKWRHINPSLWFPAEAPVSVHGQLPLHGNSATLRSGRIRNTRPGPENLEPFKPR
jgi:hypothetical protein